MSSKVPAASDLLRKATRRQEYSAATKMALVDVAQDLFSRQGYASTSLDEIVAGARVTKGALYHHFGGKRELFEAACQSVEDDAMERIRRALMVSEDPWEKAVAGMREFLEISRGADYRRLVLQDGPAVLGQDRYREHEERSAFGIVQEIVGTFLGTFDVPDSTRDAFARLLFGALSAAGAAIATADDPAQAAADTEGAIVLVLAGIRAIVERGVDLPTVEPSGPVPARAGFTPLHLLPAPLSDSATSPPR